MAVWLVPTLKAILPHLGSILSVAVPVFTKKDEQVAANQALLQQQVTELQSAVSLNAQHIKELAAQMLQTVTALESAAEWTRPRRVLVLGLSLCALLLSGTAFAGMVYLYLGRT